MSGAGIGTVNHHSSRSTDMKTLDTERISLYATIVVTVGGWVLLVMSLADSLFYPTIV